MHYEHAGMEVRRWATILGERLRCDYVTPSPKSTSCVHFCCVYRAHLADSDICAPDAHNIFLIKFLLVKPTCR